MDDDQIRRLLLDSADPVPPPALAAASWQRAQRVRRTRRATAGAVATVLLLTAGTTVALRHAGVGPAPTTPGVTATGPATPEPTDAGAAVHRLTGGPPVVANPLRRLGDRATTRLSVDPVRRALALHQTVDPATGTAGEIRVLGDDGVIRVLDVGYLANTRDQAGNEAAALKSTSLAPDGRTAAFPQTGALVLIDLTTARTRSVPLAGYLERIVWTGHRQLLVAAEDASYLVDLGGPAAAVTPVKLPVDDPELAAWDIVALDPAAPEPGTVTEVGGMTGRLTLRTRSLPERDLLVDRPVSVGPLPESYRVNEFYGQGWRSGDRIARAAWTATPTFDGAEGVAVLDRRTGEVTHLLDLGRDRMKGCCEVLGWEQGSVLFRLSPGGLARWSPRSGRVDGLTGPVNGPVSLAATATTG